MWRSVAALGIALSFPALAQQPLTGRVANSYRACEAYAPHHAFAVGTGSTAFRWIGGASSLEKVIADAMAGCAKNAADKPCTLYAVNNVGLNGHDWRVAAQARDPAAADIGRLRPHPMSRCARRSAGGWVSIAALARGAAVDGVIAVAPAHHGETHKMSDVSVARSAWQQIIGGVKPGPRVAVVLFAGDTYDVGGRGEDARAALARNGVRHLVIDQPRNFTGHGAGAAFARAFGACLFGFIESGTAACQ